MARGEINPFRRAKARAVGCHPTPDRWVWHGGVHFCSCQWSDFACGVMYTQMAIELLRSDEKWYDRMLMMVESSMLP